MFAYVTCGIRRMESEVDFFGQVVLGGPCEAALVFCTLGDWDPWSVGCFGVVKRDRPIDEMIVEGLVLDDQGAGIGAFACQSAEDPSARHRRIDLDPRVGCIARQGASGGQSIAPNDDHSKAEHSFGFDFDVEGAFAIGVDPPSVPGLALIEGTPKFNACDWRAWIVDDGVIEFEGFARRVERVGLGVDEVIQRRIQGGESSDFRALGCGSFGGNPGVAQA